MKIETGDVKWLGKRIVVYVDGYGRYSPAPTNMKVGGIEIIGITKPNFVPRIVLGSRTALPPLGSRMSMGTTLVYVHNQEEFKYGLSLGMPFIFDSVEGEASNTSITHCRKCGYENYSGAANQKDGSYLCKQCDIFSHIFGS